MIPDDYLLPVWRCEPNHGSGTFTVGLDPREAAFVLERGWATLDGVKYNVSADGCDPNVQGDGRVMVRCYINDPAGAELLMREAEAKRRLEYRDWLPEHAEEIA